MTHHTLYLFLPLYMFVYKWIRSICIIFKDKKICLPIFPKHMLRFSFLTRYHLYKSPSYFLCLSKQSSTSLFLSQINETNNKQLQIFITIPRSTDEGSNLYLNRSSIGVFVGVFWLFSKLAKVHILTSLVTI